MPTMMTDLPSDASQDLADFHAFAQGRPISRIFQTVSASQAPAPERYSFWTGTQLRNVQANPPDYKQKQDFQAYVMSLATGKKEIHYSVSDALGGVRTAQAIPADQSDELSLLYILKGQFAGRFDKEEVIAAAGAFARALASSRLTPLLRSHLDQCPKAALGMSAIEQQTMLEATEAFTISLLRGVPSQTQQTRPTLYH